MATIVQTFSNNALPSGFTKRGTVQLYKSFQWDRLAKNGSQVDPGVTTLPQTSDFFCLIDDPRHNGSGTRQFPGDDMANFYIDHHDGFYTRGCRGAELIWTGVSIPAGGAVHFHYIFLRGEFNTPFNAFGQFLAVDDSNRVVRKLTLSQSRLGSHPSNGSQYRWKASGPIGFPDGFKGHLRWAASNGEMCKANVTSASAAADKYPSALAIDFISILTP